MGKIKRVLTMVMVVALLLTNCSLVFAANDTNVANKDTITIKSLDHSKVAPIDPATINPSTTQKIELKAVDEKVVNGAVTTNGGVETIIWATVALWSDEDTVTVKFESLSGNITPCTTFSGTVNIFDVLGNCSSSTAISGSLFYTKTWKIPKKMSSVEEYPTLVNGTAIKNFTTYTVKKLEVTRTKQLGGSYNSIVSAMGGERHHCFAAEVYASTTVSKFNSSHTVIGKVSTGTAPVILMTTADHKKTASWGSSSSAKAYRNKQLSLVNQGKYLEAMNMDIDDIRNKFGSKYNVAISKMWIYATSSLNWYK